MLQTFRKANCEDLTEFWNRNLPPKYHVDSVILRANTFECPTLDWGASFVSLNEDGEVNGFVAIKHPSTRLYPVRDPDEAHLSAIVFKEAKIAIDLLKASKRVLRERGIQSLTFGRDSAHFFPGCPTDLPALKDLLLIEGFEGNGEHVDLVRDVSDYEAPAGVQVLPEQGEISSRPLTPKEVQNLKIFLENTFPGRWVYDTSCKLESESDPTFVQGLFVNDHLKGFAVLQNPTCKKAISGAVWRKYLGENWCTLGPIGICPSVRGKGLGDALLASALTRLKNEGMKNCLIDWTTLTAWYEKHGFKVANTYKSLTLKLSS